MLERHQIEAFLVLAEELHFGRTAERLRVSTSRVSQTIRQVERKVAVPLFHRTSRRVELTPIGRQLVAEVAPAWSEIELSLTRAIDAGRGLTGRLRVGFVGPAAGQLVARVGDEFHKRAPGCELVFREAPTLAMLGWLQSGEVDLALAMKPQDDSMATGPVLVREAMVVAVPNSHPYAGRQELALADLAGAQIVGLEGMAHLPAASPAGGQAGGSAATLGEALTLVGLGQGVLPVPAHVRRYHPRPDLDYVPLVDAPRLEWALVWLPERAGARVRAFNEAAAESVGD